MFSVAWASRPCFFFFFVIPAQAGIHSFSFYPNPWLPRKQPRCSHATQVFFSVFFFFVIPAKAGIQFFCFCFCFFCHSREGGNPFFSVFAFTDY